MVKNYKAILPHQSAYEPDLKLDSSIQLEFTDHFLCMVDAFDKSYNFLSPEAIRHIKEICFQGKGYEVSEFGTTPVGHKLWRGPKGVGIDRAAIWTLDVIYGPSDPTLQVYKAKYARDLNVLQHFYHVASVFPDEVRNEQNVIAMQWEQVVAAGQQGYFAQTQVHVLAHYGFDFSARNPFSTRDDLSIRTMHETFSGMLRHVRAEDTPLADTQRTIADEALKTHNDLLHMAFRLSRDPNAPVFPSLGQDLLPLPTLAAPAQVSDRSSSPELKNSYDSLVSLRDSVTESAVRYNGMNMLAYHAEQAAERARELAESSRTSHLLHHGNFVKSYEQFWEERAAFQQIQQEQQTGSDSDMDSINY